MASNETTAMLLKFLQRVSLHFGIQNAETISFKKRNILLDQLKEINKDAWLAINNLIESQMRLNRILTDKEKQEKNNVIWSVELESAKNARSDAGIKIVEFFNANQISLEGLTAEL